MDNYNKSKIIKWQTTLCNNSVIFRFRYLDFFLDLTKMIIRD